PPLQLLPAALEEELAAEELPARRLRRRPTEVRMVEPREQRPVDRARLRHAPALVEGTAEREAHRLVDQAVARTRVEAERRLRQHRDVRDPAQIERRRVAHAEDE